MFFRSLTGFKALLLTAAIALPVVPALAGPTATASFNYVTANDQLAAPAAANQDQYTFASSNQPAYAMQLNAWTLGTSEPDQASFILPALSAYTDHVGSTTYTGFAASADSSEPGLGFANGLDNEIRMSPFGGGPGNQILEISNLTGPTAAQDLSFTFNSLDPGEKAVVYGSRCSNFTNCQLVELGLVSASSGKVGSFDVGGANFASYTQYWVTGSTTSPGQSSVILENATETVAVPEPASFLALGVGLLGLTLVRRRRVSLPA